MDLNIALSELKISDYRIPSLPEEYLDFSLENHFANEIEEIEPFCPFIVNDINIESILSAEKLTNGNDVKEVYAVELSNKVQESFLPGDTIGIIPENRDEDLLTLFSHLGITKWVDKKIKILRKSKCDKKVHGQDLPFVEKVTTINSIFKSCLDINCTPRKVLIRVMAHHTKNEEEKKLLEKLCSNEGSEIYTNFILNSKRTFLELILMFKTCCPPVLRLIEHLPKLLPRPYSIASSPLATPNRIKIVFSVVRFGYDGENEGLCTGMLKNIIKTGVQKEVKFFFRKSNGFNLPEDEVPIILIGPGTGIAPFIGFLQHRKMQEKKGNIWLFYGCRYKSRDFLFRKDLQEFVNSQILSKLIVAFSRENDGDSAKYVQDNLKKYGKDLCELIMNKGGKVYVCGDARNMRADVFNCLAEILETHTGMTNRDASTYLKQLQRDKRYLQDIWL